jgi:indolepyruvate ferredoxin oxidoreductase beta subunit
VLALMPLPGEVDVVIASELMEAGRALQRGLVTADRTTLRRVHAPRLFDDREDGHGRRPRRRRQSCSRPRAKREACICADFAAPPKRRQRDQCRAVRRAGRRAGACRSRASPVRSAIARGGVGVKSSLKAFAAGFDARAAGAVTEVAAPPVEAMPTSGPASRRCAARIARARSQPAAARRSWRACAWPTTRTSTTPRSYLDRLMPLLQAAPPTDRWRELLDDRRGIWRCGCPTKTPSAWPT